MPKAKNKTSRQSPSVSQMTATAGLWVTRFLMLTLGIGIGLFLGVVLLAKGVWEVLDQEVDGQVVRQEGNVVTLKDSSGQEYSWEIVFEEGGVYELDGIFQGKKLILTDVDRD